MIAYKKEALDNLYTHEQLENVFSKQCISKEELDTCRKNIQSIFTRQTFLSG